MRWAEALHATAFLIDEDQRIATDRIPKVVAQPPHLIGRFDIALEQDEGPRVRVAEEGSLTIAQLGSVETENSGKRRHLPPGHEAGLPRRFQAIADGVGL